MGWIFFGVGHLVGWLGHSEGWLPGAASATHLCSEGMLTESWNIWSWEGLVRIIESLPWSCCSHVVFGYHALQNICQC